MMTVTILASLLALWALAAVGVIALDYHRRPGQNADC